MKMRQVKMAPQNQTAMQEKMARWKVARAEADRLEAEILAHAQRQLEEGEVKIGEKVAHGGAMLHYCQGRGRYDYEAAVRATALPKTAIDCVVALNTKPVTDWRGVWMGLGQNAENLTAFYTDGTPAIKLVIA